MEKWNEVKATVTRKALEELWLDVSHLCNLACTHCLFACSPESDSPGKLTLAECQKHINQAMPQGLKSIYITGGEPLLWSPLFAFLDWYYTLETVLPLTILTNGTLITAGAARKFSPFALQGLNLRISMECYTRNNHENFRGYGSFDRTISGIKNLNDVGIRPWIAYVNKSGGSLNSRQTEDLARDFHTRLKQDYGLDISGLKIIAAYSKGRFAGQVHVEVPASAVIDNLNSVQCAYGVAVSKLGLVPCPILTDVPQAVVSDDCSGLVGQTVRLDYDFCASCFAAGSTCGQ